MFSFINLFRTVLDSFGDQFRYELFNTSAYENFSNTELYKVILGYKREKLFNDGYIIFPLFEEPIDDGHWFLSIIEVVNDVTDPEKAPTFNILIMDSVFAKARTDKAFEKIVRYLVSKHVKPIPIENIKRVELDLKLYIQQKNNFDCGPFVIYYTWLYFSLRKYLSTIVFPDVSCSNNKQEGASSPNYGKEVRNLIRRHIQE